jgi:CRP/FNR family transcriptional regulator
MSTPIDNIPFFKGLPIPSLMTIMNVTKTLQIEKGKNLFSQGDEADGLYVLLSGKMQVYIFSGHVGGTTKVLADLEPGQFVGEFGLIDGDKRSASVRITEAGEVLFLPAIAFAVVMDNQPVVAQAVCDYLCEKVSGLPRITWTSPNAKLIHEKNVRPSLINMKTLCKIMREHNKQTAVLQKG